VILIWLERALIAVGVVAAVWCAAVLLEARFTRTLAPVTVTMALPGDEGRSRTAPPATASTASIGALPLPPAPGAVLARLEAPSLHLSTTVLEGSDDGTLRRGAGHIEDTPLPGGSGNVGIAGHRDTVFRPLKRAAIGDPIDLTTGDRVYHYRVSGTRIVGPDQVEVLDPTERPTLTLVTCYPFEYVGHAPRRFIVRAELIGTEP
jgi:sortase A